MKKKGATSFSLVPFAGGERGRYSPKGQAGPESPDEWHTGKERGTTEKIPG